MEHRKGKTIMKTAKELQEEKRELERQIRLATIREEKAKKDKATRGAIKAQQQAQLNITPQVEEIIKEQQEQKELERKLKEKLNLSSLYTQQDNFRAKVEKATTQEERRLLKKRFYSYKTYGIIRGLGVKELTQEQEEIIIAKQKARDLLDKELRDMKRYTLIGHMEMIVEDIKYLGKDFERENEYRVERVITYFKKFMNEEQAQNKLQEMIKPHRAKAIKKQIIREEEYITTTRKNIAELRAKLGEF